MKRFVLLAAAVLALPATASATTKPSQHSHPKISLETAKATAQAEVPGGKMRSHELEKEHGKLIYSFEFKVPGRSGVQEVNVDAMTGKVVNIEHESSKAEQHEKATESKKSTTAN